MSSPSLEDIVSLCKRRGFLYQGSEIYGGLAGTWDYGPLGVQLKRNMTELWWQHFVEERGDIYGIDSAILMNQKVWQASGHVATFTDPLVECKNCQSRFRADKIDMHHCPTCGQADPFDQPRQFNLMFKTHVGPVEDDSAVTYLRPETAQGMFVNFKNVVDSLYPDLPFGLAQIGRSFRNEISPRDFIFRSREFEIMELEYFVSPGEWEKYFELWRQQSWSWFDLLGLAKTKIKEVEVQETDRAHYSQRTIDFYYDFPSLGFDEIGGLAYRSDFDLKNHQKSSGKNLQYQPKDKADPFIPHVIEPTYGVGRNLMAVLADAYSEDEVSGEKRIYLKLPFDLAPVKVAVSPLLKNKPALVTRAREIYNDLKKSFGAVVWDDNGNIGKRYRRQDEIGTPYCVTIDFETVEGDGSVTLRSRDSTEQRRFQPDGLANQIH
jgi:glycyl-tRNA synthetase